MKLALSRAMLLNPDMLLLDEPTNHLDQFAVKWLTDYIINLTVTIQHRNFSLFKPEILTRNKKLSQKLSQFNPKTVTI